MEYEYSDDKMEMLYETLSNIELAITRLQERTNQVHSADDFRLSPWGMEKLDAACMVLIAIGESVKTLDKFKKISNGGSAGSQLLIILLINLVDGESMGNSGESQKQFHTLQTLCASAFEPLGGEWGM